MITLEHVYWLTGLMMLGVAIVNFRDRSNARRLNNAAFWAIYAVTFLVGSYIPDLANGFLVIAMVLVASIRGLGQGEHQSTDATARAGASRFGNKLFIPALAVPIATVAGTFIFKSARVNGSP
jgi:uncharacterized membrane protein